MAINFNSMPSTQQELKPRIVVIGVGGAGGNAVNNMILSGLEGVEFVVANTDAQSLSQSKTNRRLQLGVSTTQGLGAGSRPDIGRAAAEEAIEEVLAELAGSNMAFITAGMGGGTGTGAAPIIARAAREQGILTVGVITKPFQFEGHHRMRLAEAGIEELSQYVDTLIVIPNQNLFRVANEKTTFADAFKMADDVLCSGVRGVTDLMVMPGLINLDFADIRTVMGEMGKAHMGTGEACGERRAIDAAEAAIANPLLDDTSMSGAKGVLINITGGPDLTLFEVDEAANRIRDEADSEANIIFGSTFDPTLEGKIRISVVATGIEAESMKQGPSIYELISQREKRDRQVLEAAAQSQSQPQPQPQPQVQAKAVEPELDIPEIKLAASVPAQPKTMMGDIDPTAKLAAEITAELNLPVQAFIPPAPASVAPQPAKADPFAVADYVNAGSGQSGHGQAAMKSEPAAAPAKPAASAPQPAAKAKGGLSLFGVVTGIGRSRAPAAPVAPAPAPASSPAAASKPAQPLAQPRLGGVDPQERPALSRSDEDTLDIPTFLRRQAN
jgi:cell division protein FtsZ